MICDKAHLRKMAANRAYADRKSEFISAYGTAFTFSNHIDNFPITIITVFTTALPLRDVSPNPKHVESQV